MYICFILIQGGSIAAAWVSMRALGVDGYTSKAKDLMETTDKLRKGIAEIDVCLLYLSVNLFFSLLNSLFQDTVKPLCVSKPHRKSNGYFVRLE